MNIHENASTIEFSTKDEYFNLQLKYDLPLEYETIILIKHEFRKIIKIRNLSNFYLLYNTSDEIKYG